MAALLDIVKKGSTNRSVTIRIIDATAGTPETGVVFDTSGIAMWYRREGATLTAITEADLTTPALDDAHADGGFLHISDGEYRLDLPDAAFATGANHVDVGGTVTGMVVIGGRVRLVDYDPEDTVRLGLTALPNAAADAAGGLVISDAGALDADAQAASVAAIETDTADMQPKLGTVTDLGGGATLADNNTDIAGATLAIETDTQDIQSRLPAALVSGRMDSSIDGTGMESGATSAITSAIASMALFTGITSLAEWLGLIAGKQTGDATARTEVRATGAGSGTFDETTDSLEAVRDKESDIETDTQAIETDTQDIQSKLGTPTGADISADIAAVKSDTAATLTDTADMQPKLGTPAGADMSADIAAVKSDTAATLTDTADMQPKLGAVTDLGGGATLADNNADMAGATFSSSTDTLEAILNKETDIETDTQDIQSRLPAALVSGKMDSDATAISGDTTAADNLEASTETIVTGAAIAGTLSTTQMSTDLTEATDDHYNGRILIWRTGALAGQATDITDYDGGAGKVLTFTAVTEAPSEGDTFVIV